MVGKLANSVANRDLIQVGQERNYQHISVGIEFNDLNHVIEFITVSSVVYVREMDYLIRVLLNAFSMRER
jgi:hypothetical protein